MHPLLNQSFLLLEQSAQTAFVSGTLNLECNILPSQNLTCPDSTQVNFAVFLKQYISVVLLINVMLH